MRQTFVHDAVLDMDPQADIRAPGAAVTVQLCGHWDHEPPCPVAPHHTGVERAGREVRLRILFATEPVREAEVRQGIDRALSTGVLAEADDRAARWSLRQSMAGELRSEEHDHAERLRLGPP